MYCIGLPQVHYIYSEHAYKSLQESAYLEAASDSLRHCLGRPEKKLPRRAVPIALYPALGIKAYHMGKRCANQGQKADLDHRQCARQEQVCEIHSVMQCHPLWLFNSRAADSSTI